MLMNRETSSLLVVDVQERLLHRVEELDIELHEDAFQYWSRQGRGRPRSPSA